MHVAILVASLFGGLKMRNQLCVLGVLLGLVLAISVANDALSKDKLSAGDESQIRSVFDAQVEAWNHGEIEHFMNGYWNSDQTTFVGASGIKKGWQAILDNYRHRYPDRAAMGTLTFSNLEVHLVDRRAAYALGEFKLHRQAGDVAGYFSLYLRKFSEGWRIVVDHTTACLAPKD